MNAIIGKSVLAKLRIGEAVADGQVKAMSCCGRAAICARVKGHYYVSPGLAAKLLTFRVLLTAMNGATSPVALEETGRCVVELAYWVRPAICEYLKRNTLGAGKWTVPRIGRGRATSEIPQYPLQRRRIGDAIRAGLLDKGCASHCACARHSWLR